MPFPTDGASSPVLDDLIGGPAAALTVVALVATPAARTSGWAARAAAAVAAGWRGPRRIILADLDLEQPSLHDLAGVPNEEGVVDLIDYGLSLERLVRRTPDGAFDVLPAGLFALEPGAVLRSGAWERVLGQVAASRGTLLAYLPLEAAGADAVVRRAGAVLVLAEEGEGPEVIERLARPYAVLGILVPPSAVATAELGTGAEPAAAALAEEPATVAEAEAVTEPQSAGVAVPEVVAPPEATADAQVQQPDLVTEPEPGEAPATVAAHEAAVEPAHEAVAEPGHGAAVEPGHEAAIEPHETQVEAVETAVEPGGEAAVERGAVLAAAELLEQPGTPAEAQAGPPTEPEPGEHAARDRAPEATEQGADAAVAGRETRLTDEEFERIRLPKESDREALIAELRNRQRAARLAGEPGASARPPASDEAAVSGSHPVPASGGLVAREMASESRADAAGLETLMPPARTAAPRRGGRYRHAVLWSVGVVLLTSLLAGAWHFLSGRLPRPGPAAATPDTPAIAEAEPPAVENALPFVVAIEAHRDLALAVERIADLQEIEPELAFHIEPVEREGVLYYHVMGGPVPDSAVALALRDTLIARGHKTGRTPTDVRATPLAFFIGDYATADDAREQADVLRRLDIPGYVLPASAADRERVFRLYVGGFSGEAEAGAVGQMLRAAGIRDTLVTRTGVVRFGALTVPDSRRRDSTATGSITP